MRTACINISESDRGGGIAVSSRLSYLTAMLLSGGIGIFSANTLAADADPSAVTVTERSILDAIDARRDYVSEKVVNYSKRIDHFFGDERYFQENNESVIQFDLTETMETGGNHSFLLAGKAKLDLPAAQRRFQLVLESDPEQKTTGEVTKDQPVVVKKDTVPSRYAASLRFEKKEESLWHLSSDAGINLQIPLDPFVRVRGSYAIPFDKWRMKLTETVFWFNTIGAGETTQIDMERVLSAPVLFRSTSTATCLKSTQSCDLRQDLTVFHTLNERTALLYQASVLGVNKPKLEETAYVLLMRYRYRLHKDWIFFEVIPQLNFPKTDSFKLNPMLLLRLELLFGGNI